MKVRVEANAEISAEVEFTDVPYTQKHFISSKFFIAICS
jgi:hypothetical protein